MSFQPIPEGHEGLIAHLVVEGAKEAMFSGAPKA